MRKSTLIIALLLSFFTTSSQVYDAYNHAELKKDSKGRFIGDISVLGIMNRATLDAADDKNFLKEFTLKLKIWDYLGEPMEMYAFQWKRKKSYTVKVNNRIRNLSLDDLKDYPDLQKRFLNIRPSKVDVKISGVAGDGNSTNTYKVGQVNVPEEIVPVVMLFDYIVKDVDLLIAKEGEYREPTVAGSPSTWNEFFKWSYSDPSIGPDIDLNITETSFNKLSENAQKQRIKKIKDVWKQIKHIKLRADLKTLEWPELEMIDIIKTYDRYKKQKKLKKTESDDDFWSGEEEVVAEKAENDDFWSGGTKKKTKDDFWSGKGSTEEEVNVQKSIATATGNQYIGQKEVLTKRITISYYDHGEIDGDRINIKHNGKTKANNVTLRSYDENLSLDLEEGVNRISFEALNQGSAGQNTASFTVYDANNNVLYTNEWKINTGFKGTLLLIKL
ncbi:hypothetical protein [Croceibacter atlanticus]|jgi:hypothetical protein|uniref:Uncharacterized protein n=1 Tax=Croceibacter atlanticus (strain ATCC BAA-628 / JCM 21780 / CIP 108009 / IAM 15332 / KCTC 12090 / HTCC2559) TaxID=216432 RepID=A3U7A8_CROAH|nr:hypothetical protein [Croceibacter atlanticus]EAP88125.1 hypothetical protein CA2559_05180 [Croceibacter atlanticus HTCC2559]